MSRVTAAASLLALLLPGLWVAALSQPAGPPADAAAPDRAFLPNVPLADLKATRQRPLFTPSRRPVPTVAAQSLVPDVPMIAPVEEPLRFTLLGIIRAPEGARSAVVMDETDHRSYSLKLGDMRRGWVVRSIDVGAVTLQRQDRKTRLTYQPAMPPSAIFPPLSLPAN